MATMVKEKRREKKKTKVKHESQSNVEEQPSISRPLEVEKQIISDDKIEENVSDQQTKVSVKHVISNEDIKSSEHCKTNKKLGEVPIDIKPATQEATSNIVKRGETPCELYQSQTSQDLASTIQTTLDTKEHKTITKEEMQTKTKIETIPNEYQTLNARLERIAIPSLDKNLDIETLESKLENPAAYIKSENTSQGTIDIKQDLGSTGGEELVENVAPSAPVFFEVVEAKECPLEPDIAKPLPSKLKCMPLEEAIRVFGGKEIAEVRAMSEREEALVEAGPQSGPEHPLVDLLTTFRSSLIAVERERTQLSRGFNEEEKFRNTLWKVEKRNISLSEDCPCGATVELRATYEHAELLSERLPIAKMKLEGLLRDVQDSYCHHQHAALLAHCQIEQQISEIIKSNKNEIREALSLILQALRMSDTAPPALATALQRWAKVLSNALLDGRDLRQLLFLLHHLFRQSRSVRWASRIVRFPGMATGDRTAAAQMIALLDILLDRRTLDTAKECLEDPEEGWEEVTAGGGGAVGGALRERDLLPLLRALPLAQLIATLTMFTRNDITQTRESEWCDHTYGRGVLHSCCGVRAFLHVMAAAVTSHASYEQLTAELRGLSAHALHALAGLYLHTRDSYTKELEDKITSELEAAFAAGYTILAPDYLDQLPATLLGDDAAREYCFALMVGLHENTSKLVDWLPTQPVLPCTARVRAVTAAAVDRHYDNDLGHMVLQFLCQTGIRRVPTPCPSSCAHTARSLLPRLLRAHPYLHAAALRLLADLHLMEPLQPSSIDVLSIETWRPSGAEVRAVLDDWASRCSVLLQRLLLRMDYTPHTGLSLETQLSIGAWLCEHVRDAPPPDWAWSVLKRLRLHASCWGVAYDAPPPHSEPTDVFSIAYAILSSSWGHSIPVICHEGIQGLCTLARARPPIAVHCLKSVMLAMAHSPDSISFTPGFTELMTSLLKCGPTVMQRALGVGPAAGADLLLRAVMQQVHTQLPGISRSAILSSWFHALWGCGAYALLDATLLAARDWQLFDSHVAIMLQQTTKPSDVVTSIMSASSSAPLVCECVLRALHDAHVRGGVSGGVQCMLQLQRLAGERIHVDNALKKMGLKMSSEELVIYQCSTAVLSAPLHHPAHLLLWRLLLYLYLQRPPNSVQESTPPIGPLFFSGLIKSRVLSQLRKKLQETITYHEKETQSLKQKTPEQQSERTIEREKTTPSTDNNIVPELSIRDLTGESSDSDEESQEEMEIVGDTSESELEDKQNDALLLKFHEAALIMCKDFLRWLDEGEKTRVLPHHADIARYIPEQALEEAWSRAVVRVRPPPPPAAPPPAPAPPPPPPPMHATIDRILQIKHSSSHRLEIQLQSPIKDVDSYDPRALLALVDNYLADVETLAQEWSMEVARIASLDSALWDLVKGLRVRRPLQPVKKQCPQKCKPVHIHIPHQEWCISPGAERGIKENRNSARTLIRRLARSRPNAARSSAALITIARRARSLESALRVSERVWRSAGRSAGSCALAQSTLTAIVELLAERWLCSSDACVDLVRHWSKGTALQQQLVGALVRPWCYPAAAPAHSALYAALITAPLPSHAAFSHLSKFELTRWSERADPAQRRELLEILMTAAQRRGPNPHENHHMLLELIGVHTASIITGVELPGVIVWCARASVAGSLPPAHWTHIVAATNRHAGQVTFDQLGHVLRELGVIWWEARSGLHGVKHTALYAVYSAHIAALLHALQIAFVAAAVGLSYAPERVSVYAWSGLQESWSPWLSPHATPPLLPSTGDDEVYTPMLQRFVHTVRQVMEDCPGTSPQLLRQISEWCIQSYLTASSSVTQEGRVQASALLAGLAALPWEGSWVTAQIVPTGLMVCARGDHELRQWCARTWRHATADHWLRASVSTDQGTYNPAHVLPHLLQLFTSMNHESETLDQACQLPWHWLSEEALEEAMDRFFVQYHDPRQPYHDLPQFRVILSASGLLPPRTAPSPPTTRGVCVSRWVRAAAAPALHAHLHSFCTAVLAAISDIAPYIESCEGEVEALLGRAIVIMCEEPAANVALPVWQRWVSSTSPKLMAATLSAVCCLTAIHYFVELANVAVRVYLAQPECISWQWTHRWSSCSISCEQLCTRGALYAAYAAARAQPGADLGAALRALLAATLDFIENEAIIALWICVACRVGSDWYQRSARRADSSEASVSLLSRWAADSRRSLIKLVTMQADTNLPTPKHRLLCRLAQCIISNSDSSVQAYEAACTAVLGSKTDVLTWAKAPHPRKLPRLAIRLFPNFEKYFKDELEFTPED